MIPRVILALVVLALSGCASIAHQRLRDFIQHGRENNEAWLTAHTRLHALCAIDEAVKRTGAPPLVKQTNRATIDDWEWETMPPYRTIVAVHEDELRKIHRPKPYEEYVFGAARYLGEQADREQITTAQMRHAFTETWTWMIAEVRIEAWLLVDDIRVAQATDARTAQALNAVASGLAIVLSAALVAGAIASANTPQAVAPAALPTPTSCQVRPGWRSATGGLSSVYVTCW